MSFAVLDKVALRNCKHQHSVRYCQVKCPTQLLALLPSTPMQHGLFVELEAIPDDTHAIFASAQRR